MYFYSISEKRTGKTLEKTSFWRIGYEKELFLYDFRIKFKYNRIEVLNIEKIKELKKIIDSIDKKIIKILSRNSRTAFVSIAKELNISESTIRQRVAKLLKHKIIKKFTIESDPATLGYNTVAFIGINTDPSKLLKVVRVLGEIDELISIATATGDYMIVCESWTENSQQLDKLIDQIEKIEGVRKIHPSIIIEKVPRN